MAPKCTQDTRREAELAPCQAFALRYVLTPVYRRFTSWEKAAAIFETEAKRLMALSRPLSLHDFQRRVPVEPILGLEDRCHCWSAEMVLDHLVEVGTQTAISIVDLSHGRTPTAKLDDVNPTGGHGLRAIETYVEFSRDYTQTLLEDVGCKTSRLTHPHPWLGKLNAHGWACFGALHQTIHRRQMERIVAGLRP